MDADDATPPGERSGDASQPVQRTYLLLTLLTTLSASLIWGIKRRLPLGPQVYPDVPSRLRSEWPRLVPLPGRSR